MFPVHRCTPRTLHFYPCSSRWLFYHLNTEFFSFAKRHVSLHWICMKANLAGLLEGDSITNNLLLFIFLQSGSSGFQQCVFALFIWLPVAKHRDIVSLQASCGGNVYNVSIMCITNHTINCVYCSLVFQMKHSLTFSTIHNSLNMWKTWFRLSIHCHCHYVLGKSKL